MIRRWLNAKANASVRNRQKDLTGNDRFGQFEHLEEKRCLAFVGFFDGVTLTLEQTVDHGDVVIDNSGVGGAFRTTDNSGSLTFVAAENVIVNLLDNTANQLDFNINGGHSGDVELNLGDGPRDLIFGGFGIPGIANAPGGDVTVTAGTGPQFVQLAPVTIVPIPFQTGGNATFDLGDDFDTVYNNENFVIIGNDLNLTGVNLFQYTDFLFPVPLDADLKVGGDLNMDTSNESTESFLLEGGTWHDPDPDAEERSIIRGDFNYTGGDDIDHVDLNMTYIQGNMTIDLGEGIPFFGDPQNVTTQLGLPKPFGPYFEIDGDISISAGDSQLGNVINLAGYSNGGSASFFMGDLEDEINYSLLGSPLDVMAEMGAGVDTFNLSSNLNTLAIDFGNDLGDTFINNFGFFGFDADYTNYHWFDFFYTAGDNVMVANQLIDTGDIIIDNNGGPATGIDWQFFTTLGGVAPLNPAQTLTVNMLSNTGNNVEIDLDNPVIAFLNLNLGDGDRLVNFTGDNNNPLRDINITADQGEQHVELSVNAPLAVATLNIDLGADYDTVDDDANDLTLSEDMIFRGVNLFENDGFLTVGRHVVIDTLAEMEENIFANNSQMFVAGNFTYTGGDGRDELRLNGAGGNTITLTTMIDLGGNTFGGTQYALLNSANTFLGGPLTVLSSNEASPDVFDTNPAGSFSGDINVSLGNGTNDATITGFFGGNNISYTGGDGVDTVVFGTTGLPAVFTGILGQGDDFFTLLAGASLGSPLQINFGGNNDTFLNLYGPFDFDAELIGLNGFNHLYEHSTMTMHSTQVSDQGPVTIDNNGPGNGLRFMTTTTSELTPVDNLIIDMLGGSLSPLTLDWDNAFTGDLTVNLESGPRTLDFTGTDNSIGGNLAINATDGIQTVGLAVNNALSVGGTAQIDLGAGADAATDGGNDINVTSDLTMLGVNTFVNSAMLNVGGHLSVGNSADSEPSVFDETGSVMVGGDFSYLGNDADDFVNLVSAFIGGNISVDLADGNNSLFLYGTLGGTTVGFDSGSGDDIVEYGMGGGPASIVGNLGAGNDTFNLVGGTMVTDLDVDFGNNNDTFINGYGPFDFPAVLRGLDGFDHTYDPIGASLTSVQVGSVGSTVTLDTNGAGNSAQVTGNSTTLLGPVDHISISMLSGSGDDLNVDLDNALAGDLTVNLNDGNRVASFTGTSNSVGGALNVTGGNGAQTVNAAVNANLSVGSTATMSMGSGNDMLNTSGNDVSVPGNLTLNGLNQFTNNGTVNVGGNLLIDSSAENENSSIVDNAFLNVVGDFDYLGGGGNDIVTLNAGSSVGGNIDVRTGDGDNVANLQGAFGGTTIDFRSGSGVDHVTLGTMGSQADVDARLGTGDDTFVLNAGTDIAANRLRVDFGGGDDTFTSSYGAFDFNAVLLNLDGYNAIYDFTSGNLDITQVADTGDVTIDNNGGGTAVRFGVGTMNEITPANDLRLILQDNTSTNVIADFDNARVGNTVIQLRSGDRNVDFIGSSNTFTGLLRVEAADGVQIVNASVVNDLNVDGTFIFNGRDGSDRLIAENAINVTGAMLLRGVNTFVNNFGVNVGGDFNMITMLEDEDTKLISNNSFMVGGNLSYLGGGGVDALNFKTNGATIGGFTYIDVATANDSENNQRIVLTGGFSTTNLVVDGGNAIAGNFFSTDSLTNVGDQVIVNFSGSNTTNTAIFSGTYGGTYGTYRGGTGGDFVVFSANDPSMLFAALTGDGDDTFTIASPAMLDFLYVDFGNGTDFFDNQLSDPLPFANNIFNN